MLHLSPDRLAALADDEPTALEAQHVATCALCARERSAHRSLVALARREHSRAAEPLTDWTTLSERLRGEALIRTVRAPGARRLRGGWMRSAAAVMLAAGGIAAGRVSAGAPALPIGSGSGERAEPGSPTAAVGSMMVSDTVRQYRSTTDAVAAFLAAQREMQHAAAFIAEREQDAAPELTPRAYHARLAATEGMVAVSRAALYQAPTDPYINQYYLASLGARDAAIRQIGRGVPPGAELVPF
jgi:hypothetical protein